MVHLRLLLLIGLLSLALPLATAQTASEIRGSALLGTTQVVTFSLDSQQSTQAQLYEAWANSGRPLTLPNGPVQVGLPHHTTALDAALIDLLQDESQGDMLVYLNSQADLRAAWGFADWNERGAFVVRQLQDHAAVSQASLRVLLDNQQLAYQPYWIVNAIKVHGDLDVATMLAARSDVALVAANTRYEREVVAADDQAVTQSVINSVPWGLDKINAPRTWAEWGARGQGIIVANIDTGVMLEHDSLLHTYRGWSAQGINHDYNWFDPTTEPSATPIDTDGHGTHTMGTVVGGAFQDLEAIGVAPAARWIAARGCASHFCDQEALIAGAQWMLAPTRADGSAPRPDLRPHVINNSWAGDAENPWYYGYVNAWNASGIVSIFANGNKGATGCGGSEAPGVYDNAFSVGATGANDEIANFSSRGYTSDHRIKPDMAAPGVGVISAAINGDLREQSGTSMAAPHVAGVVALLFSANPSLIGDLDATYNLLKQNSTPLYSDMCGDAPDVTPNAVFGAGRLDAYAAVQSARVDVPWLQVPEIIDLDPTTTSVQVTLDARQVQGIGEYHAQILVRYNTGDIATIPVVFQVLENPEAIQWGGRLLDQRTRTGVFGRVQLDQGPLISTNAAGVYTATVMPGRYTVMADSIGYVTLTQTIDLDQPIITELRLIRDAPHLVLEAQPISVTLAYGGHYSTQVLVSNIGPKPLALTTTVPPYEWSIAKSSSEIRLYDLSNIAPIALNDDQVYTDAFDLNFTLPAFGSLIDSVYVSSNGWISANYIKAAQPSARCLPDTSLPLQSFAPFWTDLNPEVGGTIRAGHVNPDLFVVSYEEVPKWNRDPQPSDPRYSFQVALHADGTVEYLYGSMGALPLRWSIGTGFNKYRGQSFACYPARPVLGQQRWTLFNQAPANVWLSVLPEQVVLNPGDFMQVDVNIIGLGYRWWRPAPLEGTLKLVSNDPLTPSLDMPISLQVGAPQSVVWMPVLDR